MLTTIAFALGAALAMSFLSSFWGRSVTGYVVVAAVGAVCTAIWYGRILKTHTGALGWLGRGCAVATVGLYSFWLFIAFAFGMMLGWTVPIWLVGLLVGLVTWGAVSSLILRRPSIVPLVFPVGVWIAVALSGWIREEGVIRCDDLLALDPSLELVVATRSDLAECVPGETKPAGRYPRTIWQAPDGDRIVFTTQGRIAPGGLDGAFCESRLSDDDGVHCVGPKEGKSHGLIPIPEIDRLIGIQYALITPSGPRGGVVFEMPLSDPIEILEEHWFEDDVAQGFYEPRNKTLYLFTDSMRRVYRAAIPGFERLEPIEEPGLCPSEMHYSVAQGLGVACHGPTGAALQGDPFKVRYFSENATSLLDRIPSATWGCNWNPESKKVYTTLPNLGLLVRIDFDSGRIEKRWPIGFGMRSVEYDRARGRVYVTDFLRGWVLAFDEATERVVERWFVGRFARWVRLTPDGRSLLATSNLGIVRIPL